MNSPDLASSDGSDSENSDYEKITTTRSGKIHFTVVQSSSRNRSLSYSSMKSDSSFSSIALTEENKDNDIWWRKKTEDMNESTFTSQRVGRVICAQCIRKGCEDTWHKRSHKYTVPRPSISVDSKNLPQILQKICKDRNIRLKYRLLSIKHPSDFSKQMKTGTSVWDPKMKPEILFGAELSYDTLSHTQVKILSQNSSTIRATRNFSKKRPIDALLSSPPKIVHRYRSVPALKYSNSLQDARQSPSLSALSAIFGASHNLQHVVLAFGWCAWEEKKLLDGILKHNFAWDLVASVVGTKSASACEKHYYDDMLPLAGSHPGMCGPRLPKTIRGKNLVGTVVRVPPSKLISGWEQARVLSYNPKRKKPPHPYMVQVLFSGSRKFRERGIGFREYWDDSDFDECFVCGEMPINTKKRKRDVVMNAKSMLSDADRALLADIKLNGPPQSPLITPMNEHIQPLKLKLRLRSSSSSRSS